MAKLSSLETNFALTMVIEYRWKSQSLFQILKGCTTNVKRKICNFFRWWEPTKQEYKIIAKGVRLLDDAFEHNYEVVPDEHKVLELVNKLVAKLNSMIRLL